MGLAVHAEQKVTWQRLRPVCCVPKDDRVPKSFRQLAGAEEPYIQETLESCKDGRCCQDRAALDAAYEQYVIDPKAPWNKGRRS